MDRASLDVYALHDVLTASNRLSWFMNFRLQWSPNSVPYLLTFWSKMVSSLSSAKQATQEYIQSTTVDLSRAYLKSRLECAQAALDGEVDGKPLC